MIALHVCSSSQARRPSRGRHSAGTREALIRGRLGRFPAGSWIHAAALPAKLAGTGVDLFSVLSGYLFDVLLANRLRTFELSRFARFESGRGFCIEALAQSCCPCELHRCVQGCSRKVKRRTRGGCHIGRKDQEMNPEDDPIAAMS